MTGLLVSVRSAAEARDALAGGAAIIDVKEPAHGSLGRADAEVWREVADMVQGRAPISAALGELNDSPLAADDAKSLTPFQFAKLGLAGCANLPDWRERWREALRSLPATVLPVAVSYGDWRDVHAPAPEDVIEVGDRLGCAAWLIDTRDKARGGLLAHVTLAELAAWISIARRHGMLTLLAGSLNRDTIEEVLPLAPDYIAVRGTVCRSARTGCLDADRVRELASRLQDGERSVRQERSRRRVSDGRLG